MRERVWHSAGQEPTVPGCKGSAQRVVFPADSFLGDVPSAQHKSRPQTHQDLLYRLTDLNPSCSHGKSMDADVFIWATLSTFVKEGCWDDQ